MTDKRNKTEHPSDTSSDIEVLVCATCRQGQDIPDGEMRPGEQLFVSLKSAQLPPNISIKPVKCLSNCSKGCTVAFRSPQRWTYVYGNLNVSDGPAIITDGVSKYQNAADGVVPWGERPEHLRKNCIARIPPIEDLHD